MSGVETAGWRGKGSHYKGAACGAGRFQAVLNGFWGGEGQKSDLGAAGWGRRVGGVKIGFKGYSAI